MSLRNWLLTILTWSDNTKIKVSKRVSSLASLGVGATQENNSKRSRKKNSANVKYQAAGWSDPDSKMMSYTFDWDLPTGKVKVWVDLRTGQIVDAVDSNNNFIRYTDQGWVTIK